MYFLGCNGNKFTRLFTTHLLTCCAKKSFGEKNIFRHLHINSLVFLSEVHCCTVQIFIIIAFLIIFDVDRVMSPHFWLDYQNLIVVNPSHFLLQGAIRFNGAVILTFSNQIGNQFLVIGLAAYTGWKILWRFAYLCIYCFAMIYILVIYINRAGLGFPNEMSPQFHCLLFILVQFLLLVSACLRDGWGDSHNHWTTWSLCRCQQTNS